MDQQRLNTKSNTKQNNHDDWDEVHHQMLNVQKKSLQVSKLGDPDEEEADTVARKVMRGQSATISGSSGGVNRKGEGSVEAGPEFQTQLQSSKGSGESLPASFQHEMGSKMGADFGDVKIHTGSEASSMSNNINARAFTSGRDIYFNEGQYDTQSRQGQELIAHELVHTKQQENSPGVIQRKITYNNKEQKFANTELSSSEALRKMVSSAQVFNFSGRTELDEALLQRSELINIMLKAMMQQTNSLQFADDQSGFSLPADNWQKVSKNKFIPQPGISPAVAVQSIFENGNFLSILDCNMTMVAAHYYSILKSKKTTSEFDALFPGGNGLVITQVIPDNTPHPFKDKGFIEMDAMTKYNIVISPSDPCANLIPGDWVYFSNVVGDLGYMAIQQNAIKMFNAFAESQEGYNLIQERDALIRPDSGGGTIKTADDNVTLLKRRINGIKGIAEKKRSRKERNSLIDYEASLEIKEKELAELWKRYDEIVAITDKPGPLMDNAWQGEHAVYIGNNRFAGYGVSPYNPEEYLKPDTEKKTEGRTYDSIITELFIRFQNVVSAYYDHPVWKGDATEKDEMKNMTLTTLRTGLQQPQITQVKRIIYPQHKELGK